MVFCTRDRPDELRRAVRSVIAGGDATVLAATEIVVVDDGDLPVHVGAWLAEEVESAGARYRYVEKSMRAGLLSSRVEAVAVARGEVLLFLDDDVEVAHGYLPRLLQWFRHHDHVVGVGGVDELMVRAPSWMAMFETLTAVRSRHPGRLSLAGYSGSMDRWLDLERPITTEYLLGCNMAFRRRALSALDDDERFEGACLGEDILLSAIAARSGPLMVDPGLRVEHHQSPAGRHSARRTARQQIVNHRFLVDYTRPGERTVGWLTLAALGFALRYALSPKAAPDGSRWGRTAGVAEGLVEVLRGTEE